MDDIAVIRSKINNNILRQEEGLYDLMGGLMGKVLLIEATGLDYKKVLEIVENSFLYKSLSEQYSFSSGWAGVNWVYTRLNQKKILSRNDYNFLCTDDRILKEVSIEYLGKKNYDYLHGALGIAWYFLYKYDQKKHGAYFDRFIDLLLKLVEDLELKSVKRNREVNIGLSHGITSILKFCLETCKKNIRLNDSLIIVNILVEFLINNINKDSTKSYFPNVVCEDINNKFSRLAWCYGDLGIAIVLYQTGLVLNIGELKNLALKILKHSSSRRDLDSTWVTDANLCHGSAGAMHIFNKMYAYTNCDEFKQASEFWYNKTVTFGIADSDDSLYFEQHNVIKNTRSPNNSFLEGSIGVSLSLYSYETRDFNWDYCLMLND